MNMRALSTVVLCLLIANVASADESKDEAHKHFRNAELAYKTGDFEKALEEYQASYKLFSHPALLFNLGQTYRRLKQYEKAVQSYESFLREAAPNSEKRDDAKSHVAELKALIASEQKSQNTPPNEVVAPEAPPPPPAPPPVQLAPVVQTSVATTPNTSTEKHTPTYRKWWLWTVVGAGAAAVAIGLGVGLAAHSIAYPSAPPAALTIRW